MVRLRKHSRGNDSKDTPGKYPAYKEREASMRLKWLSILINILAIALITASLFVLLVVVSTPAGQVPQVMGFSILRVMSVSMEPEIPEQSMLLVHKTDPDALQVGDVITFFSSDPTLNGTLNTHRIIRIDRQRTGLQFVTKGDANALADRQGVKGSQVVGRVILVSPLLGRLVGLVSTPLVFGLLILLPLLFLLVRSLIGTLRLPVRRKADSGQQAPEDIQSGSTDSGKAEP